jgi:RHS repeat-associated protein
VHHAGGSTQVVVNQQQNGGEWVPLGTYGFAQDLNHGVVLTDQADGMVVADEMRFEVSDVAAFTYYLQPDHLDTPRVATDGALAIRWRWDASDPFGSLPPTSVANGIELQDRFPGQVRERNVTTGLHYNYFRDYDPSIGRYIQSDPIGLEGGINTYSYVGGNPTANVDPFGLEVTGQWIHSPSVSGGGVGITGMGPTLGWRWLPPRVLITQVGLEGYGRLRYEIECTDNDACGPTRKWKIHGDRMLYTPTHQQSFGPNVIPHWWINLPLTALGGYLDYREAGRAVSASMASIIAGIASDPTTYCLISVARGGRPQ